MASTWPAFAKSIARDSVSPVSRPELGVGPAEREQRGVRIGQIDQRYDTAAPGGLGGRGDALDLEPDARLRHTHLQHTGVSDHHQASNISEIAVGEDFGRLLRSDAGAIAGHQRDGGQNVLIRGALIDVH